MKKSQLPSTKIPDIANSHISRGKFLQSVGLLAFSGAVFGMSSCNPSGSKHPQSENDTDTKPAAATAAATSATPAPKPVRVAADPTKIPPPIHRSIAKTHKVTLEAKEMTGELKPRILFHYMTFDGQVPAPMIRARQGDTIEVTLKSNKDNTHPHNADFHSCYGSGGGADFLTVGPGETKSISFKVNDPGAFIYHCAVGNLDYHISSGMFGMILVEPKEGLPPVDREFYFGQHDIYIKDPVDENTVAKFDFDSMLKETAQYVVLNGAYNGFTSGRYGALKAKQGETIRIYFVNGGPNLISSFHPIGNIWSKFWLQGSLANEPFKLMQTVQVNPGSCAILEMKLPVPEKIRLADHSITRTARQGLLAEIEVSGTPVLELFNQKI